MRKIFWIIFLFIFACASNIYKKDDLKDKGVEEMKKGDVEKAILTFNDAISKNPENYELFFLRGKGFFLRGKIDEALENFQKYYDFINKNKAKAPNYTEVLEYLGDCYFIQGKYIKAIYFYESAMGKGGEVDKNLLKMAKSLYEIGEWERAKKLALNVKEKSPFFTDARILLAEIFLKEKKYNEGENILVELIKKNPEIFETYHILGNIYLEKEEYENAVKVFEKALSINTSSPDVYFKIGISYIYIKKLNSAEEALLIANKMFPDREEILNALGVVYLMKGSYDESIKYLKKASLIAVDSEIVVKNLKTAYTLQSATSKKQ